MFVGKVANIILKKSPYPLDYLQVESLCILCQGYFLATDTDGYFLFPEIIIKRKGGMRIPELYTDWVKNGSRPHCIGFTEYPNNPMTEEELEIIDAVVESLCDMGIEPLLTIVNEAIPWIKQKKDTVVSRDVIKQTFVELLQNQGLLHEIH